MTPGVNVPPRHGAIEVDAVDLGRVADTVRRVSGAEIAGYAPEFFSSLVSAALSREGMLDVQALLDRFQAESGAVDRFLASLWLGTTSLFRDPGVFQAIRRDVAPILRSRRLARIWIAGCSTGEELYGLAIVLRDEGLLDRCRIHATDVNARALESARRGVYPSTALREGIPRYLASGGRGTLCEIYTAEQGMITFDPSLAANVTFARHDLGLDGPPGHFDLVLCRNVLIWFGTAMRDRALDTLRASLVPGGVLVLGRRETPRDSAVGAPFERLAPDASLWRLTSPPGGATDAEPDAIDIAARGARAGAHPPIPAASAGGAASDPMAAPEPGAALTTECHVASR